MHLTINAIANSATMRVYKG